MNVNAAIIKFTKMENMTPEKFYRRLLAMIAQEIKVPLANALLLLKLNTEKTSGSGMEEFLKSLEKQLTLSHSLFSELLGWSKTYFISASGNSIRLNLKSITSEIIRLAAPALKAAEVENKISTELCLSSQYIEIYRFVIRCLLLHGVKFSYPSYRCSIDASKSIENNEIQVNYEGVDTVSVIKAFSHSSYFLSEESEGDIGLLLCRDCLSELGSGLSLEEIEKDKVRFSFTIPFE